MRGRRLMGKLQVVTKKSLTKYLEQQIIFVMTKISMYRRDIVNLGS